MAPPSRIAVNQWRKNQLQPTRSGGRLGEIRPFFAYRIGKRAHLERTSDLLQITSIAMVRRNPISDIF